MFKFEITPDGGEPYEVVATSRDVVLWERIGKDHSLKRLEDNLRMTDMYSLAHVSAKRQGIFTGSLDEFMSTVDLTPEQEEPEDTRPTDPDR